MASYKYNAKTASARIHFRYEGQQHSRVEKVDSERHAQRMVALIEETLIDLARGKLVMPPDVDPRSFIMTGGRVVKRPEPVADPLRATPETATIATIFDTYAATLTTGS